MRWSLLASLDDGEQRAVLAAARSRSFAKGEIVFHEGDRSDSVHLVGAGHLAVVVSTPDGDLATLNVLGPGDWFGELSMLREQAPTPRSATIRSLDASQTWVLTQSAFHQLCKSHPGIERLVDNLRAARIRKLSADLLEARYVDLDRRLYGALLDLAAVFSDRDAGSLIPLTQDQLADMVGGTRPSVNQILQRLAHEGVVQIGRGKVMVLDAADLARRAGR
ncbi:MAG: Crp/Fnr family transcriptional regulator [Aeromicrobium sp.]